MPIILGIDVGTNSVGSAWIDTRRKEGKFSIAP